MSAAGTWNSYKSGILDLSVGNPENGVAFLADWHETFGI
jgi:hypothetical protein